MALDGIELQVVIIGSPHKGALNYNKPVHCILFAGATG